MAGKITTAQDLNDALVSCLQDLMNIGASSKGDTFDETVRDKLKLHLNGAQYVTTEQWTDKEGIFYEHSKVTLTNCFDFNDLPPIIDKNKNKKLDLLIVDKPNGSQKWPDLLVIYQGIGLPIEIKSAKQDVILWNSGLPRPDSLYIYNCYGKSKTTCFLGQHAINEDELNFLVDRSAIAAKINERHGCNKWSYYVRDMFNSNQSFFESKDSKNKCEKYQEKIYEYENEIKKLEGETGKRSLAKVDRLNNLITKYNNELITLTAEYNKQQANRIQTERETLQYIESLCWTPQQKANFNHVISLEFDEAGQTQRKFKP